jgi:hypothetical protein
MSKRVYSEVEASINVDQLRRKIEQENRQPGEGSNSSLSIKRYARAYPLLIGASSPRRVLGRNEGAGNIIPLSRHPARATSLDPHAMHDVLGRVRTFAVEFRDGLDMQYYRLNLSSLIYIDLQRSM